MTDNKTTSAKPHTELRRQERPGDDRAAKADTPTLKPRTAEDRLPGGDEDDLFNDIPV